MFLNWTKIDCAVSGRRYAIAVSSAADTTGPLAGTIVVPAVIVEGCVGWDGPAGPVAPCRDTGNIAVPDQRGSTGPTRVLNIRLKALGSVRSLPPQTGHCFSPFLLMI